MQETARNARKLQLCPTLEVQMAHSLQMRLHWKFVCPSEKGATNYHVFIWLEKQMEVVKMLLNDFYSKAKSGQIMGIYQKQRRSIEWFEKTGIHSNLDLTLSQSSILAQDEVQEHLKIVFSLTKKKTKGICFINFLSFQQQRFRKLSETIETTVCTIRKAHKHSANKIVNTITCCEASCIYANLGLNNFSHEYNSPEKALESLKRYEASISVKWMRIDIQSPGYQLRSHPSSGWVSEDFSLVSKTQYGIPKCAFTDNVELYISDISTSPEIEFRIKLTIVNAKDEEMVARRQFKLQTFYQDFFKGKTENKVYKFGFNSFWKGGDVLTDLTSRGYNFQMDRIDHTTRDEPI